MIHRQLLNNEMLIGEMSQIHILRKKELNNCMNQMKTNVN